MTFSTNDIPDLTGKVVIVTGANTGIGKVSALEMARKGAHVILACRSKERTDPAIVEIKAQTKNEKVEFMELNLSSLKSVKQFAQAFVARKLPLHVLLNNAGIAGLSNFTTTEDGIEMQFGTNHVGHAYLTQLLLPVLKSSKPSRVVMVSSQAHTMSSAANFVMEKFSDPASYGSMANYGISKTANILFANELDRQLQAEGIKNIYCNSLHPGVVNTEVWRNMFGGWFIAICWPLTNLLMMTPETGALTQLYCCTHPDIVTKDIHAKYFVPNSVMQPTTKFAQDMDLAKKLWDFTNKLIIEKMGADAFKL